MDEYRVKIMSRAVQDINGIYEYIATEIQEPETALHMVDRIEQAILSLEQMPFRCPERKTGIYKDQGYRQIFAGNYTIVFRINEMEKTVIVVTVQYTPRRF